MLVPFSRPYILFDDVELCYTFKSTFHTAVAERKEKEMFKLGAITILGSLKTIVTDEPVCMAGDIPGGKS